MMKMRATQVSQKGLFARRERKRIRPDEKVPLDLNDRERELILQHTFAADQLTRRLRIAPVQANRRPIVSHWTIRTIYPASWQRRQTTQRTRT
jgi:hypothetical protein